MPRMDAGGERIGVNGAAALLDVTPEKVRRYVQEGRLRARRGAGGGRGGASGAAAWLDVTPEKVRRYVQEGRLRARRGAGGDLGLVLGEVLNLARGLAAEAAEEETFAR